MPYTKAPSRPLETLSTRVEGKHETGLIIPANISEYCMYPYKRAQLQAILTQMNSNLSLRLCKANTKDVGVQVSLRVDKSVQCSLGPQTLHSSSLWDKTSLRKPIDAYKRALIQPPKDGKDRESQELTEPAEANQLLPPTWRPEGDKLEKLPPLKEVTEEDAASPQGRKSKLVLEPKYGYFHCKDCKTRWESAYVWCVSGTNKVSRCGGGALAPGRYRCSCDSSFPLLHLGILADRQH
ncbi:ZAR1 [Sigmodon hispidus]